MVVSDIKGGNGDSGEFFVGFEQGGIKQIGFIWGNVERIVGMEDVTAV